MIIRQARPLDAGAMADLLNEIIAIGGTTAHQTPVTAGDVRQFHIDGPDVLAGVVAEEGGQVVGWQSVEVWAGEAHIGTFVQPALQARGVGLAMFGLTRDLVAKAGVRSIIAFIRADNASGLAFYARAGFVDYGHDPCFALNDGRVVGRVHRRFDLG